MSSDVKIAQGLRRALKARQAKLDTAVAIFEEAEPERRQKAALFLLGTHEEAEVEKVGDEVAEAREDRLGREVARLREQLEKADRLADAAEWAQRHIAYAAPEILGEKAVEAIQRLREPAAAYRAAQEGGNQ